MKLKELQIYVKKLIKLNKSFFFIFIIHFDQFFIGERSNFMRCVIMSLLFFYDRFKRMDYNYKIFILSKIITTIFLMSSKNYHWRYWQAFLKP